MGTARWDTTWQCGGTWRRKLVRKDRAGTVLGIGEPCVLELREIKATDQSSPVITVNAVVADDGAYAVLTVTPEQVEPLAGRRLQLRLIVTDRLTSEPRVTARGYLTVRNRAEG